MRRPSMPSVSKSSLPCHALDLALSQARLARPARGLPRSLQPLHTPGKAPKPHQPPNACAGGHPVQPPAQRAQGPCGADGEDGDPPAQRQRRAGDPDPGAQCCQARQAAVPGRQGGQRGCVCPEPAQCCRAEAQGSTLVIHHSDPRYVQMVALAQKSSSKMPRLVGHLLFA